MEKRKPVLLLVLALALTIALCACGSRKRPANEPTTQQTAANVDTLDISLSGFGLSTSTWSSPNGATVNLTAIPSSHTEGQTASFIVRLGQTEEANVPCEWNGTEYTASADLNAADGYGYYVVITAADGARREIGVNTPENPYDEALVNLASSLDSYCVVTIDNSNGDNGQLNILGGTVVAQLPLITNAGQGTFIIDGALILTCNEQEVNRLALNLTPAEMPGSYEQALTDLSFPLPAMTDGQELSLRAEVNLSNGQRLTAPGGSWMYKEGNLEASMG